MHGGKRGKTFLNSKIGEILTRETLKNILQIYLHLCTCAYSMKEQIIEINKQMKQTIVVSTPNNSGSELSLLWWQQTFFGQTNNNVIIFI